MLLCILFVLNLIQSLLDIIEDVFYIFDTYGEANQIWRNTCFLQLLFAELAMGVTGWMEHTGAGIGYTWVTMLIMSRESINLMAVSRSPFNPKAITPQVPFGIYFWASA